MARGILISFEGIDGAGKTTQAELLAQKLQSANYDVLFTREPGGTPEGEKIREILLTSPELHNITSLLLYSASRCEHWHAKIAPAIKSGKIVICDRYIDSTIAYQGYGGGADLELIESINELFFASMYPDITFILNAEPSDCIKRINNRSKDKNHYDVKDVAFYQKVGGGFREISKQHSKRCHLLDDVSDRMEVNKKILDILRQKTDIKI